MLALSSKLRANFLRDLVFKPSILASQSPSYHSNRENRNFATTASTGNSIVFVDGVRTPFLQSGTDYKDMLSYELQKHAVL